MQSMTGIKTMTRCDNTSVIMFLSIFCLFLGFLEPMLGRIISCILAGFLIFRTKYDAIPALFILTLEPSHFSFNPHPTDMLRIGSIPLQVSLIIIMTMFITVLFNLALRPKIFKGLVRNVYIYLWLASFPPVMYGTYLGYLSENVGWTRGLMAITVVGGYFYGLILSRNMKTSYSRQLMHLWWLNLTLVVLVTLNMYFSHLAFLSFGLTGAIGIYYLYSGKYFRGFLSIGVLFSLIALKFGFTTTTIIMLSMLFSYISQSGRIFLFFRFNPIKILKVGIITALLFSVVTVVYGKYADYKGTFTSVGLSEISSFSDKLTMKLLVDRFGLWNAAVSQITSPPYILVPSGRPLDVSGTYFVVEDHLWRVGAHNTILEIMRNTGYFSGTIAILIIFIALKSSAEVLKRSNIVQLRVLASAILAVSIAGIAFGDYPITTVMGYFLWIFAGMVYGNYKLQNNYERQKEFLS